MKNICMCGSRRQSWKILWNVFKRVWKITSAVSAEASSLLVVGVEAFEAVVSYWIEEAGEVRLMTKVRVSNGLRFRDEDAAVKLEAVRPDSDRGLTASTVTFSASNKRRLSSSEVDSNTWLGLSFLGSTGTESSSVRSKGFSNSLAAPALGGLGRSMSGFRAS